MAEPGDYLAFERDSALLTWMEQFAPFGVVTLDKSFQVQSWNHWMDLHSGRRSQEVAGKNLFTLYPDLEERRLLGPFQRALEGESSVVSTALHGYLLPLPSPFRETAPAFMLQTARIGPLFSKGVVCGIVLVIEDVTQRENQAIMLGQQHQRDELLSRVLTHLLKAERPRKAVRTLLFKIAEQLDLDTFLLYLRDPDTGHLNLEALGGIPAEADKDLRGCPFIAVLSGKSNTTLSLNSVQTQTSPEYAALRKLGVSAAVVLPLIADERNLGLLCLATCSRVAIPAEESDLLTTIAQCLAIAIDRENSNLLLFRAKEQLREHAQYLENRVQERTARLQETITELETFSYTVAHDLRAPARSMTGYCEVLLEDFPQGLTPEARKIVERISRASRRMETLTRDLLEFSKVSRQDIALSTVRLEPLIEDLVASRAPAVRQSIKVCSPLLPVRAHRGLLQHVFSNLVDNAIKFVRPGAAPKITIATEIVSRSSPNTRSTPLVFSSTEELPQEPPNNPSNEAPRQVRVWVRDEGIGISPEAHQKIFGLFERDCSAEGYEGTGIGLAIVARAMQRMGGTCGVESEPGKGSGFWIELPEALGAE